MALNQQERVDVQRRQVLKMLSAKSDNKLTEFSSISSDVDAQLFRQEYIDTEAIVDSELTASMTSKKTKTDEIQGQNDIRLLALASQSDINHVLEIIIDELFSFKSETNKFIELSNTAIEALNVDKALKEKLKTTFQESFDKIYSLHKFDLQTVSHEYDFYKIAKLYFIFGKCRFYIEYDDLANPTSVKAIHYLDPRLYKLERFERRIKGGTSNIIFYRINKASMALQSQNLDYGLNVRALSTSLPAIALDAQIIDIDWSDVDVTVHPSYVAGLERSFNIYRLMERTRIAVAVMNSTFRSVNVIPTKGQGRAKSIQTLRSAIQRYQETVTFDDNRGNALVNGELSTKFNKELWVAETSSGKPDFQTQSNAGVELQDMGPVAYFLQRFQKETGVPSVLLDRESQNYWSNDETQISLELNRFAKRLDRIRRSFSPMIAKPIWTELSLNEDFKEHKSDSEIRNSIVLKWHTRDVFAKRLELTILEKTLESIESLSNYAISDDENGVKIKMFSRRKLIKKYLDLTDEELKAHQDAITEDIKLARELVKERQLEDEEPRFDERF